MDKRIAIPRGAHAFSHIDFRAELETLFGDCFVVTKFEYKGLILDYAIIATDRLIEVRQINSKEECVRELAMVGRAGGITFDKHKSIRDGKFISNAFYFLAPARILTVDELPKPYGLITYPASGELDFKKTADWIDPGAYLPTGFYKTLAKKLAIQLYK